MVTIKDIAKIAGVSHTTVSRSLNDSPLIRSETKDKIKKIAKELNYTPNMSAKRLVNQKSYIIGLFFSSIQDGTSDSFLVEVIKGIHSVLPKEYSLTVQGLDSLTDYSLETNKRYDGVILMSQSDEDDHFIHHLLSEEIPFAVLNRQLDEKNILNVTSNDRQGVKSAIDFSLTKGYRKIAFIEGKVGFRSTFERKKGYLDSLKQHDIPLNNEFIVQGDYSIESGQLACEKLLSLSERPELIFCSNDDMAVGAMKACHAKGLSIPGDISIIGFDDIPFVKYTSPPLTTVHKPIMQISQIGTIELLKIIQQQTVSQLQFLVDTSLEIRQTVN
ncbi:LacI family transcriptional regulator [Enterococcus sp. JM4C]|uniref:LacI family DNA-binding transcriptional regulator n=1 Tax=Candidatus Enterococcus huntleyi TaxID=1857217 RepID=UPI00137ADA0A|nr:LacI family DNA-binding transcriptional regulator [Enterococcus sp. JM4C]KAF1299158.1 LacI family transcriptional regulator [Enterococcus sp. JM4C]